MGAGAGRRRGAGGLRRSRGLTWRGRGARDPRAPPGPVAGARRGPRPARRCGARRPPDLRAGPGVRGGSEGGLPGLDPRRCAGGSCNRRAGGTGLPPPGMTLVFGLRASVSSAALRIGVWRQKRGARPPQLSWFPDRSRRSRCRGKISGCRSFGLQVRLCAGLGAPAPRGRSHLRSRAPCRGPPRAGRPWGGRRPGAARCPRSALWEARCRAHRSRRPCEGPCRARDPRLPLPERPSPPDPLFSPSPFPLLETLLHTARTGAR